MERRGRPTASHEARLVRSARSLDRSRRLIASAQEREEKALATLLCHLAQTGQTHAVLGVFEILLEDDGLSVRRIASASGAQLPLPQLEHPPAVQAAELRVADPAVAYTPTLYEACLLYTSRCV